MAHKRTCAKAYNSSMNSCAKDWNLTKAKRKQQQNNKKKTVTKMYKNEGKKLIRQPALLSTIPYGIVLYMDTCVCMFCLCVCT